MNEDNKFCYLVFHEIREMSDCDYVAKQARVQMSWWNTALLLVLLSPPD